MDAIAQTAYYCCGVRARDAASAQPICGDRLAQRFMTPEAELAFAHFKTLARPNLSNAVRARIIDDMLREKIAAEPGQIVFLVGAGFDTRAYRLGGGAWVEMDQADLLARKNELLPLVECPTPLMRLSIDFVSESLADKLLPWAGTRDAVVVLEGVSMYLTQAQQKQLFATLRAELPGHTLICDLMTRRFSERIARPFRDLLKQLGTDFAPQIDTPERTVVEEGYNLVSRTSIVARARELGAFAIPGFLLNTILRSLRDGFGVYVFKADELHLSSRSKGGE